VTGKDVPVKLLFVLLFSLLTVVSANASITAPKLAADAFPAPMPKYLGRIIEEAAAKYELDPNFLAAMAFKESAFNPNAVSRRGAQGILQLMPRTAKYVGVKDAFDPRQNVFGGAKYVRELLDRFDGNVDLTLAGYNLGPDRIAREGARATPGVIKYVSDIKNYYRQAIRTL
jgi:soluble lytic murein transglycosylase-like protein